MAINYIIESEQYRPTKIKTLLVGEAPPSSGKKYFYGPKQMSNVRPIIEDRSLPATIFGHYFQKRPTTKDEYIAFLLRLRAMGIFLIDICDDPIKVRGCSEGVQRIIDEIPRLREKMAAREIRVPDRGIVFLLARTNYLEHIRREFPDSQYVRWIDFRCRRHPSGR